MTTLGAVLLVQETAPAPELRTLLGPERAAAVQAELLADATDWASRLGARSSHTTPPQAPLPAQIDSIFAAAGGPLLVVWPRLPRLRPEHARGALSDLDAGSDLVFGPLVDGGFYLFGLSRPTPNVIALLQEGFETTPGTPGALAAAAQAGLELGYLRPERGLRSEDDLEAALADPLTPPELLALLRAPAQ
jgi:glycosyltransferase A (GT-A) superfamily protein (DUF2064 family)